MREYREFASRDPEQELEPEERIETEHEDVSNDVTCPQGQLRIIEVV